MLVLGIRTAPKEVRYALLECDGNSAVFTNSSEENRLKIPNNMSNPEEKLPWIHDEFERIFRQNTEIEKIAIKTSEYSRSESKAARLATYMEGVVINLAGQKNIPITIKTYTSLGTRRGGVKSYAEAKVQCTSDTVWNEQMADAIAVAWSERRS